MKRLLLGFGLLIVMLVSSCPVFAADKTKMELISIIGRLTNEGHVEQALEKCNTALEEYPFDSELYYWRATIRIKQGEYKKALSDIDKSLEYNPNDSSAYVVRGIIKSELDDNDGALKDLETALRINPKDASAYSMRACVKISMGDFKGANSDLEIANKYFDEELASEKDLEKQEEQKDEKK